MTERVVKIGTYADSLQKNNTNSIQPAIVKAPKDRRKSNHRSNSDFTDIGDWPSLGAQGEKKNVASTTSKQNGVEHCNSKERNISPVDNSKGKENKEQNHCADYSEEHNDVADKKKKPNSKQKWVPLDIDIAKSRGKRDRSPKQHYHREKNDEENYRERDHDRQNYNYKGSRGRNFRSNRGGRNHGIGRNNIRQRQDSDIQEYAAEYFPISKIHGMEQLPYSMPYNLPPFYYEYRELANMSKDPNKPKTEEEKQAEKQIKDTIRKQVEYYFSEDNLCKDFFLRRKMDSEGYLPISLIATFRRIMNMNTDVMTIYEAIRESDKLEIGENFKVRTKFDPQKWVISDVMLQAMYKDYSDGLSSSNFLPSLRQDQMMGFCPVAQPLSILPEPPVPKIIQTNIVPSTSVISGECLNPDVPEFIPTSVAKIEDNLQVSMQEPAQRTTVTVWQVNEETSKEIIKTVNDMVQENGQKQEETKEEKYEEVQTHVEKKYSEEEVWEECPQQVVYPDYYIPHLNEVVTYSFVNGMAVYSYVSIINNNFYNCY